MIDDIIPSLLFTTFPLAMVYAAVSDLRTMTISNKLTLGLGIAFTLLSPLLGLDLTTFTLHWLAGGIVLAAAFGCFAAGWIGGGDAKLAAVIALWLGWNQLASFIGMSAVFGGVLTLAILSFRRAVLPAALISQPWVQRLHADGSGVPYGIALALAALLIYPQTAWIRLLAG